MSDANYDPTARRDTPLALKLKECIAREGPVTVAEYMQACLQDREHGYYVKRPAIGAKGDFITAPEISQVFGELIGLWCAVVWQQMGSPARLNLVELGPGRGTLMRDVVRATSRVAGFGAAAHIQLVESSERLEKAQRETLSGVTRPITWARDFDGVSAPAIIVANEFLDALPIEHWIKTQDGWRERAVGLDDAGELCFTTVQAADPACLTPSDIPDWSRSQDNSEYGVRPAGSDPILGAIVERLRPDFVTNGLQSLSQSGPVAALFIDYGHASSSAGETLQAVRNHKFESPLTSPGEADLSAHVDFDTFARLCNAAGLAIDGPITQAEFLGRLGIIERASKLMRANPAKAGEIEAGIARLIAPTGMGSRFKAIGVRSAGLAVLPGFGV